MMQYLTKKERAEFWILTIAHLVFIVTGIVFLCLGYLTCIVVVLFPFTWLALYDSARELSEARMRFGATPGETGDEARIQDYESARTDTRISA